MGGGAVAVQRPRLGLRGEGGWTRGAAVRGALTDDGRPPLDAKGLLLHGRLGAIAASLDRLKRRGELPKELSRLGQLLPRQFRHFRHFSKCVRAATEDGYRSICGLTPIPRYTRFW